MKQNGLLLVETHETSYFFSPTIYINGYTATHIRGAASSCVPIVLPVRRNDVVRVLVPSVSSSPGGSGIEVSFIPFA